MFRFRFLVFSFLALTAMVGASACESSTPTAPTPPVPGTTVLVGTVRNTQTQLPVASALVTVQSQATSATVRTALTSVDGSFRIESIVIGQGTVRVEANGFVEYSQELTLTGAEVRSEIALVPTGPPPPPPPPVLTTLGGLVTNRLTSLPINGATVTFTLTTGERFTANTVVDGRFSLNGVPVGAVGDLRVEANGHRADDSRYTVEPNLFVTIALDPG